MSFGKFRCVAFPFHWVRQCFCFKEEGKKQCLSYIPCYFKIFVMLAHFSFLLKTDSQSSPYFFFYLCPWPYYYTVEPSDVCYLCWHWPERVSVSDEDVSLLCKIPYVWENFWSYKEEWDIWLKISINRILHSLSTFEKSHCIIVFPSGAVWVRKITDVCVLWLLTQDIAV